MRKLHRCTVCGRILYVTVRIPGSQVSAYCPDRLCYLYPPMTTSRSEDPTMASYILGAVENTPVSAHAVTKALGKQGSYANNIVDQQRRRWEKVA